MAARGEGDSVLGARQGRTDGRKKVRPRGQAHGQVGRARIKVRRENEIRAQEIDVNQLFSLCLAVNLVYGQAAVTRPDGWFAVDKIKHFFMSAFIESVSYSALQAAGVRHRAAMTGAIGITIGLGIGREIHDKRTPGNIFSVRDLTWDALGAGAGAALLAHTIR